MIWPSGAISISVNTAAVTVSVALPLTDPEVAVIVADPAATPVARPVALIVAKFVALDVQLTLLVMSVVLPSEKIPFATNACVCPVAIEAVAGVTVIDVSCAAVTVTVAVLLTGPRVAVIVAVPAETPVTRPPLTVATFVALEFHVACEVMSCVVPSLYTPCADNC